MSNPEWEYGVTRPMDRRGMLARGTIALAALATGPVHPTRTAPDGAGITRTSASIHQRVTFNAPPARVYEVLTDGAAFHAVTLSSEAMKGGMPPGAKATVIGREPGAEFTLFGGVITGRHVELVPATRIVQAWRDNAWKPGVFSMVKFELSPKGGGTALAFEHSAFPDADAAHLAAGWKSNYWEPLAAYLAKHSA